MVMKVYLDGASLQRIRDVELVDGYTTNPSLVRACGVLKYLEFCESAAALANGKPISFEVLADDAETMLKQAQKLAAISPNVWVKIPIITAQGLSCATLIGMLSSMGIKVNVTACFTKPHVRDAIAMLSGGPESVVSIFAGRIADTGRDPAKLFAYARTLLRSRAGHKIATLWASTREPLNILHAQRAGANIITVAPDLLNKAHRLRGKNLDDYARETVQQFSNDAKGIEL